MPRIDLDAIPVREGAAYPPPFDAPCHGRTRRRVGNAGALTDFGVNLMTLPPGGWSSQRHCTATKTSSSMCCRER